MYQGPVVLCSASKYKEKYYLNPDFNKLPDQVKQELQISCVLFTEEVGGVILLCFDEEGNLYIETEADEDDILYDEIGAHLLIKRMQSEKKELFEQLEQYYAAFLLEG